MMISKVKVKILFTYQLRHLLFFNFCSHPMGFLPALVGRGVLISNPEITVLFQGVLKFCFLDCFEILFGYEKWHGGIFLFGAICIFWV